MLSSVGAWSSANKIRLRFITWYQAREAEALRFPLVYLCYIKPRRYGQWSECGLSPEVMQSTAFVTATSVQTNVTRYILSPAAAAEQSRFNLALWQSLMSTRDGRHFREIAWLVVPGFLKTASECERPNA